MKILTKIFLISALLCHEALARVPLSALSAPEGYFWKERKTEQGRNLRLELFNSKTSKNSGVFYEMELRSGIIIESENTTRSLKDPVLRPGRILWQPHPETGRSLQEVFNNFMTEVYGESYPAQYVREEKPGHFSYNDWEEQLQFYQEKKPVLSRENLFTQIQNAKDATWKKISRSFLGISLPSFLFFYDPVEPIAGEEESDKSRYDAFTSFPLQIWKRSPDLFLQEMLRISQAGPTSIVNLLREKTTQELSTVRLGIVALLTHNHLAEKFWTELILIERGPKEAWRALTLLNHLYEEDRAYLETHSKVRITEIPTCDGSAASAVVTDKVYHYYGGWILAARLRQDLPFLPRSLTLHLEKWASNSYYRLSRKKGPKNNPLLKLYEAAARDYNSCLLNVSSASEIKKN